MAHGKRKVGSGLPRGEEPVVGPALRPGNGVAWRHARPRESVAKRNLRWGVSSHPNVSPRPHRLRLGVCGPRTGVTQRHLEYCRQLATLGPSTQVMRRLPRDSGAQLWIVDGNRDQNATGRSGSTSLRRLDRTTDQKDGASRKRQGRVSPGVLLKTLQEQWLQVGRAGERRPCCSVDRGHGGPKTR